MYINVCICEYYGVLVHVEVNGVCEYVYSLVHVSMCEVHMYM